MAAAVPPCGRPPPPRALTARRRPPRPRASRPSPRSRTNPRPQRNHGWLRRYTRGDEVGAIRGVDDFVRLFAPIDTVGEAAFVAAYRHGLTVPCVGSARRITTGGWEVLGGALSDCTFRSGQRRTITRTLVRVAPDGASTATALETRESDDWCPSPAAAPTACATRASHAPDAVGRWLARAAHMEAASVFAFESLARELAELGAPPALVDAARRSADDERRHARMMGRLAERAGAAVPPVEVEAPCARTAFAIARENAVEGCVHETWAAMEALAQSSRAARPGVAATMGAIADDEMRHASLAWQVAAWLEPRLSEAERAAVREAREGARAALEPASRAGTTGASGRRWGSPRRGSPRASSRRCTRRSRRGAIQRPNHRTDSHNQAQVR
jgi:rubrerythrin